MIGMDLPNKVLKLGQSPETPTFKVEMIRYTGNSKGKEVILFFGIPLITDPLKQKSWMLHLSYLALDICTTSGAAKPVL
jgi:hypothetical protein